MAVFVVDHALDPAEQGLGDKRRMCAPYFKTIPDDRARVKRVAEKVSQVAHSQRLNRTKSAMFEQK